MVAREETLEHYQQRMKSYFIGRVFLWVCSYLYAAAMSLRRSCYNWGFLSSHRLPGKVISIGNLQLGGTGKTPMVIAIGDYLCRKNQHVVVLTRGYKSGLEPDQYMYLRAGEIIGSSWGATDVPQGLMLDEPMLISSTVVNLTVIVGAQRFCAAKAYMSSMGHGIDFSSVVWLLDDGYQHLKIIRDMNLLCVDSHALTNNSAVLPLGDLREVLSAGSAADVIIDVRAGLQPNWTVLEGSLPPAKPRYHLSLVYDRLISPKTNVQISDLSSPVVAAAAIARPHRFAEDLKRLGVELVDQILLSDHQFFTGKDAQVLKSKKLPVITTEKDYHRQREFFAGLGLEVYILTPRREGDQWQAFYQCLDTYLA